VKGRASTVWREDPELAIRQQTETKIETEKRDRTEDHSLSLSDLSVSSKLPSAVRADPKLPFLEMAWSPSQMQEFFNHRVLPPVWPGQKVTAVAIDGMTYKAGRQCEILYALQFADSTRGQSRWVAVTFAKKEEAAGDLPALLWRRWGRVNPANALPCRVSA